MRAGIVHEAVTEDQVLSSAVKIAADLAGQDRNTLSEHKRLLYGPAIAALQA